MLDVKLPPQDLEAEKSVLGALLVDGEANIKCGEGAFMKNLRDTEDLERLSL